MRFIIIIVSALCVAAMLHFFTKLVLGHVGALPPKLVTGATLVAAWMVFGRKR